MAADSGEIILLGGYALTGAAGAGDQGIASAGYRSPLYYRVLTRRSKRLSSERTDRFKTRREKRLSTRRELW